MEVDVYRASFKNDQGALLQLGVDAGKDSQEPDSWRALGLGSQVRNENFPYRMDTSAWSSAHKRSKPTTVSYGFVTRWL